MYGLLPDVSGGGWVMFDLHCHILPGVDDGAEDMEEAVEMAVMAASGGTRGIVATPHANLPGSVNRFWDPAMLDMVNMLQKILDENAIPLQIYTGQEIFLTEAVPKLLAEGKLLTVNRTQYVLTELDFQIHAAAAMHLLKNLRSAGYIPILAHPERYAFIMEEPETIAALKKIGCLLQVNQGSLLGSFGAAAQKTAHYMCRRRFADLVASDGHSAYIRTTNLMEVQEMLEEMYTEAYADTVLYENPYRILCGSEISG